MKARSREQPTLILISLSSPIRGSCIKIPEHRSNPGAQSTIHGMGNGSKACAGEPGRGCGPVNAFHRANGNMFHLRLPQMKERGPCAE